MSSTRGLNDNVNVPSPAEQSFIARFFSGTTSPNEIARWLRRSSFVRQELAEFTEVISDMSPQKGE